MRKKIFELLRLSYRFVSRVVKAQLYANTRAFWPIQECENVENMKRCVEKTKNERINSVYLFPFCVALYITLDSVYELFKVNFHYDPNTMPDLFSHRIYLKQFHSFGDILVNLGVCLMLAVYSCLLVKPLLEPKCVMFLVGYKDGAKIFLNKKEINFENGDKIKRLYQKSKAIFKIVQIVSIIESESFYLVNFYFNWTNSFKDYILILVIPLYVLYALFSNIFMFQYYMLTTRYLAIKQKHCITQLDTLNQRLARKRKVRKPKADYSILREYTRLNKNVLDLFCEIRAHNRFWSPYLTVYFLVYVYDISYFAYSLLFYYNLMGYFMIMFTIYCLIVLVAILFLITNESSLIVRYNQRIHRQNCQFSIKYQLACANKVMHLLKFDLMESHRRYYSRIGFTLLDGLRLNSKMFKMLAAYVSTFFMMICENHLKQN